MVAIQIISPEEYKKISSEFEITYGYHQTPFGKCLIGMTTKGVCYFSFVDQSESNAFKALKAEWPDAKYTKNETETKKIVEKIFNEHDDTLKDSISVVVKGTEFQTKVWQALLSIPQGETRTYEEVARMIDKPKAIRAAANAVASNYVGYLIPCHRVVGKMNISKYQWGAERKKDILEFEAKQPRAP